MSNDDRAALLSTNLKQLEAFQAGLQRAFQQGGEHIKTLAQQWSANQTNLTQQVLPRMGPGVDLAARSMTRWISDGLAAAQSTEGIQNVGPQMRTAWSAIVGGQVAELVQLLKNPPEVTPTPASAPPQSTSGEKPDRESAKALLDGGAATESEARDKALRNAGYASLLVGSIAVIAACALPFLFHPNKDTVGWPLAVLWSTRLLAVAALVVAAIHLFNVSRELMLRAAAASKERAMLKVVAAAAYLGKGDEQAGALVELARSLSQESVAQEKEQALVIPPMLVKELPEVVKAFSSRK